MEQLPDNAIDLGNGSWMIKVVDKDDKWIGINEFHYNKTDGLCGGWVPFEGNKAWTVESWEPLTLSPSLLCTACSNHGWIRSGRWVNA